MAMADPKHNAQNNELAVQQLESLHFKSRRNLNHLRPETATINHCFNQEVQSPNSKLNREFPTGRIALRVTVRPSPPWLIPYPSKPLGSCSVYELIWVQPTDSSGCVLRAT